MLVMNRKSGQHVFVPQYGIDLKIVEIRGNQVRIGITAPPEIKVYRGEIWKRVQSRHDAKKAGASSDG
jgi:carbon storage regulator